MDRLALHSKLVEILGSPNVYFQPPPTMALQFPCIIYRRDAKEEVYADNKLYNGKFRYRVTIVEKDPDSKTPTKLAEELELTKYNTSYVSDGLYHEVYSVYY